MYDRTSSHLIPWSIKQFIWSVPWKLSQLIAFEQRLALSVFRFPLIAVSLDQTFLTSFQSWSVSFDSNSQFPLLFTATLPYKLPFFHLEFSLIVVWLFSLSSLHPSCAWVSSPASVKLYIRSWKLLTLCQVINFGHHFSHFSVELYHIISEMFTCIYNIFLGQSTINIVK